MKCGVLGAHTDGGRGGRGGGVGGDRVPLVVCDSQ